MNTRSWCLSICFTFQSKRTSDEARKLIAEGIGPNAKKKSEATELKAKRDNTRAFKVVAKSWFSTKKKWSEDYQNTVRTRLETYVFPYISDKDVAELSTGDLLVPLKKVEG